MIKKIIFYNNFHNGDVHFSRGILKIVSNYFPDSEYFYLHKNKKGLLKDLTYITESDLDEYCDIEESVRFIDDKIYINTWYGQNHRKYLNIGGTTLLTIKLILENILNLLNKQHLIEDRDLLPSMEFENIKTPNVPKDFNVLICNNNSMSGQANNVNLNEMINIISENNPHIIFYVTDKINLNKQNIIYTSDITKNTPDLVEISYISTKCKIIVGRASGPYSFSITDTNLLDESKSFFALCNEYKTGIWDSNIANCKYYHGSYNNVDTITETIQNIINSYTI